ncbi:gfo/Idh/MocA family oxidoreductase [Coraliomargarita sinensis]|uniref:Gfo/Idh/MocA family oxidoreductase n=1 Tax=Coraliomargarita sinensis TaxID=2174842 RepID=A0A317ZDG7_9BACT|nr:Gfo/Idh/MocA family oxidoreductase [Coraliomargarita sinensis]PXA03354.1 gfo/Idh/MocA family oxidoreductase [Coraliomargarita sinensis]
MKRRTFVKRSSQVLAASSVFPTFAIGQSGPSANSKLNVAFIGSGGWIARQPYNQGCKDENLVAFCDVDRANSAENMKNWRTTQPFFEDFRKMLDKMHKEIDAVVISTPDHTHFAATLMAMERGIHVYTQKPLTHNIWQARTLRKAKHKYNVVTQMGNQGHSGKGIRQSVEAYRAGVIGEVKQVFARNEWPDFSDRHFANINQMPPPSSAVPKTLNWDLWLGPQADRDYSASYLPKKWRTFYDFGMGVLGDFGCHTFDMPVWALDLAPPTVVESIRRESSLVGVIPASSHLRFHFPAKGNRGPVTLDWFDGPQDWEEVGRIDAFGAKDATHAGRACWMVGDKGLMGCGTHAGTPMILPNELRKDWMTNPPEETIPRVEGGPFREWLRAMKGEGPEPGSNFDVSANLTEIILLGVIAQRFDTRIEWDAKAGKITNQPELNAFVREPAREGWDFGDYLWT